ncbi:MAG TPA: hypothetical protein VF734_18580 [Pseudonocardiaceae bacterium]|jgi:hypothetical protein
MSRRANNPLWNLRFVTAELTEATGVLAEHVVENRELYEWVTAVARHAEAVDAAVRSLASS